MGPGCGIGWGSVGSGERSITPTDQNKAVDDTAKSFEKIEQKNDRVYDEAGKMNSLVHELNDANQAIVDGIHVTENTSARGRESTLSEPPHSV